MGELREGEAGMTEDIDSRMTKMVLDGFQRDGLSTMTRDEQEAYLATATQAAYQLLRGVVGDEWVRGWLESALADLSAPAPIQMRRPS